MSNKDIKKESLDKIPAFNFSMSNNFLIDRADKKVAVESLFKIHKIINIEKTINATDIFTEKISLNFVPTIIGTYFMNNEDTLRMVGDNNIHIDSYDRDLITLKTTIFSGVNKFKIRLYLLEDESL